MKLKPGDIVKNSNRNGSYMFESPPFATQRDGQYNCFVKIFTAEELAIVISTHAYDVQVLDSMGVLGWVYHRDLKKVTK